MIFAFIEAEKANFPVAFMCDRLGVSRSGFYDWRRRQRHPAARTIDDRRLTATIVEIHRQSRGIYGAPRVHAELALGMGIRVGRKRVARLMRHAGVQGITRRRGRGCTRRNPAAIPSDDLVNRQFDPDGPDQQWVADITQHPTNQGWVYCAVVIDAWSRLVVGHAIADHLRSELVVDALQTALWRRQPDPGLIHHADHGTQRRFKQSSQHLTMRSWCGTIQDVGSGADGTATAVLARAPDAVAESFFASMQADLLDRRRRWATRAELASAIFEWIEVFYNRQRRHSRLGYLTPAEFEQDRQTASAEAA